MTRPDPFTYASPNYQAAIRHPHKSGEAFENMTAPRRSGGILVAVGVLIVLGGLLALRLAGVE